MFAKNNHSIMASRKEKVVSMEPATTPQQYGASIPTGNGWANRRGS